MDMFSSSLKIFGAGKDASKERNIADLLARHCRVEQMIIVFLKEKAAPKTIQQNFERTNL
jgi:hypothetical protein